MSNLCEEQEDEERLLDARDPVHAGEGEEEEEAEDGRADDAHVVVAAARHGALIQGNHDAVPPGHQVQQGLAISLN